MDTRVPISGDFTEAAAACVARLRQLAALPGGLDEHSGAPFFRDIAAVRQLSEPLQEVRSKILGLGASGISVTWASADDHLGALEGDLRREPAPVWSTMTLARAVQESAVFVCYIAEPAIGVRERLARIAATWLQDADYRVKAAPSWHPGREAATRDRQFRVDELVRGGFVLDRPTVPSMVGLDGVSVPVRLNTTERAKLLMPIDAPEPYRLASGAAHGRPWFLTDNAIERDGMWSAHWATVLSAVAIAAFAVQAAVQQQCAYFGLDGADARSHEIDAVLKALLETPAN